MAAAKDVGGVAAPDATVGAAADVSAVVAPGKTVMHDNKSYGPGQSVSLPEAEALELLALGFLVDPDAVPAPAAAEGPTFETEGGGTSVKLAA